MPHGPWIRLGLRGSDMAVDSETIERAKADLAKCRATIARALAQLETAKTEEHRLSVFLEVAEQYSQEEADSGSVRRNPSAPPKTVILVEKVIEIIKQAGKPLTISELVQALTNRGLEIGGEKPHSNLAGYLSRDTRVKYLKEQGWWVPTLGTYTGFGLPQEPARPAPVSTATPTTSPSGGGDLDDDIPF